MTVKEIAEAVGKTDRAVRNWVTKSAENNSVMAEKISGSTSTNPADYDLDETIEIIRVGLGVNAAEIYRQNATQHQNGEVATQTGEVLPFMAKMMELMMVLTDKVAQISSGQLQIEGPKQDYYSLVGFCNLRRIKTVVSELPKFGMDLRNMTKAAGLEIRKVPDERWGTVNSYPIEILDEYFTP